MIWILTKSWVVCRSHMSSSTTLKGQALFFSLNDVDSWLEMLHLPNFTWPCTLLLNCNKGKKEEKEANDQCDRHFQASYCYSFYYYYGNWKYIYDDDMTYKKLCAINYIGNWKYVWWWYGLFQIEMVPCFRQILYCESCLFSIYSFIFL